MKIVTYNVNGIKARLPRLIEYLTEQQPDVVCLQELKAAQEQATPGDQFTETDAGSLNGTVKGATGNVLTLDVGRKAPLVQVVTSAELR